MAGELIEAYRRIEKRQYLLVICLTILTVVTIMVLVFYSQLSTAGNESSRAYLSLEANYSAISASYGHQIASLQGELGSLSGRYNQTLYNLTNPYTEQLYDNYQVNIPGSIRASSTTNSSPVGPIPTFNTTHFIRYYTYNFSFKAPYHGYIILNATSSGANTRTGSAWEFLVSNGKLIMNNTLDYYSFQSGAYAQGAYAPTVTSSGTYLTSLNSSVPGTAYAPLPSQSEGSIRIPVGNGTVNVWIVNFGNASATVTFSAKYIGLRTS